MDIIIGYPHFQSINFGKSLSICQRLFAIFKWKDIIMLSVLVNILVIVVRVVVGTWFIDGGGLAQSL